jgi:ATP-dependent Clp protease, protease subunit
MTTYRDDARWSRPRADEDDDEENDSEESKADKAAMKGLGMKLLESRTILLTGGVNDDMAKAAIAQLLVLDAEDCEQPIKVIINSPGGSVDAGMAMLDMMRYVKSPIYTICAGLAASAGTILLLGGDKGHRYSLPFARYLLHQPSQGIQGQAADVEIGAREILRIRKVLNDLLAEETGTDVEKIREDLMRDHWMSAPEAVEYGLINKIVTSAADLGA